MTDRGRKRWHPAWTAIASVLLIAWAGAPALAQTSTGSVRGTVTDSSGPLPGATIVAVNKDTGFQYSALTGADGGYNLVVAPGSYDVKVSIETYRNLSKTLQVMVGQTLAVNFVMSPDSMTTENVTVVGTRIADTRSPESATNVSQREIENLPQNRRNFLNFAALAPGVVTNQDPSSDYQVIRSGGLEAQRTNAFVDGLSYKNDVIKGGAFMQDSSKGNPFPQDAVQEFRVITQNYKAEYDKAGAAIITAVTKTGGNELHGDLFIEYQNKGLVTQDELAKARGDANPDYRRWQGGFSLGGPIVRDKTHYFLTYEQQNLDDYASVAWAGSVPLELQGLYNANVAGFGTQAKPFRSHLGFAKFTWQPAASQTLDISGFYRDETEKKDFGGNTVFDSGSNFQIKTPSIVAKHQWIFGQYVNEATVAGQRQEWILDPINGSTPAATYGQLNGGDFINVGGKDSTQDIRQDKIALRDDVTRSFSWNGRHVLKGGAGVNFMKYDYNNASFGNPHFYYRDVDGRWSYPYKAVVAFGNPDTKFDNRQYGAYIQDDWSITSRLELNLGIRWDYETNMINNDWVTPDAVRSALLSDASSRTFLPADYPQLSAPTTVFARDLFDQSRYFSNGNNRKSKNMWQPRLGFSYDVTGAGKTVVFGGWGRFYDRVNLQDIYEEQRRATNWRQYNICFTAPGGGTPDPRCTSNVTPWDPSFGTKAGLESLVSSGGQFGQEIWLVPNDLKPPHVDQWNLGVRQAVGPLQLTLGYNNSRAYDGLVWYQGNVFQQLAGHTPSTIHWSLAVPVQGFGILLLADNARRAWYDGYYISVEKPFASSSPWTVQATYTYSHTYQEGASNTSDGTPFIFDYNNPSELDKVPGDFDERHRLVISAMYFFPLDIRVSTFITLSSGVPKTVFFDFPTIPGWNQMRPYSGTFGYRNVDLRLEKGFTFGKSQRVAIQLEGFNVFNSKHYTDYINYYRDPNFGNVAPYGSQFGSRRFQLGAKYEF